MGFRVLRVMNEDRVAAGNGFGTHPHRDMEIITYVIDGQLEHTDSMGNGSIIQAGEFQRLSAGSGITHSEFNPSDENETHLYQIWLLPEANGLEPAYEQRSFPRMGAEPMRLVASRGGRDGSLHINQDVNLYKSELNQAESVTLPLTQARYGWLQVVRGEVTVEEETLTDCDAIALSELNAPVVQAVRDSEFLFFDLP
jgi:redox-sensitive bicupin YhaK (pirin superfamily)